MKPLPTAPPTEDDQWIWAGFGRLSGESYPRWWLSRCSHESDRRDAAMMRRLTWMQLPRCEWIPGRPGPVPVVHIMVRLDPEWPVGHHIIDLT